MTIDMPPLRQRKEDIPQLARAISCSVMPSVTAKRCRGFTPQAMDFDSLAHGRGMVANWKKMSRRGAVVLLTGEYI